MDSVLAEYFDLKVQLDAGIRLLQGQIHNENDKAMLCHSSCRLFDGGLLEKYLKKVKEWMGQHTGEVVTILLVNNDKIPAKTTKDAFDKVDLTRLTYTPPQHNPHSPTGWPTLRQLTTAQRRIIALTSISVDSKNVPWLLDEFSYIFETPLGSAIRQSSSALHTAPAASKTGNWVSGGEAYKPNDTYVAALNGDKPGMSGNLKQGLAQCKTEYERVGGFVLVDFFNKGSPIKVVDTLNGVSNPINRKDPPPTPDQRAKDGTFRQLVNDVEGGKGDAVINRLATESTNLLKKIGLRGRLISWRALGCLSASVRNTLLEIQAKKGEVRKLSQD
ncbi:PLC-like phosphodiesterase [Tuber brumale]|nr:PLC-like phosphodiesterase [Tuber brumale]